MAEGQLPRMFGSELLEKESLHVGDVGASCHETVVIGAAQGEVVRQEFLVAAGTEDGDDMGAGWEGGGEEEGEETEGEADAGVVEEGHAVVDAFFGV